MSALRLVSPRAVSDLSAAVPGVWHADMLGAGPLATQASGHALLDAQLPGGGWPRGALSEVLQPQPGLLEWALVLPALAQASQQRSAATVLVAPPGEPFGPALQAGGLTPRNLCVVHASDAASALWAAEQALRCRDVLAVLAWLPQASPAALRRLQLAAARLQQLLWVFRPSGAACAQASPAFLRLQLQPGGNEAAAVPGMQVKILKRRGPPLAQALQLPAGPGVLAQALAAQAARRQAMQQAAEAWLASRQASASPTVSAKTDSIPVEPAHAMARIALALAR